MNIKPYLQLSRPANIITAIADILAGIAISCHVMSFSNIHPLNIIYLCIATTGLYAGGIIFNDIFDLEIDKIERPERVIPSGKITKNNAILFGTSLFVIAIFAAFFNNSTSGLIALTITFLALLYDKYGKHHSFFGPINMGLCRGANLILGMSILESSMIQWIWISFIPVCYIAAITMISRSEVHGGNKITLYFAAILYAMVSSAQILIAYQNNKLITAFGFIILHLFLIYAPLIKAIKNPIGPNIGKAVKAGVLSLIVMDAAWASVFGNLIMALFILILLPISIKTAKIFAVT